MLFIATSNPGKLRDFAAAGIPAGFRLQPLPGLASIPPPLEDAETFAGNATLKAIAYSLHAPPDTLVLADDSGLEVDALNGAPGVHSARYAALAGFAPPFAAPPAVSSDDHRNNLYLLQQLKDVPSLQRTARYRCVLAVARNGKLLVTGTGPLHGVGAVEGPILDQPRGSGGFGYDPLFLLPGHGLTMAEAPIELRLSLSHRAHALADLLARLQPLL